MLSALQDENGLLAQAVAASDKVEAAARAVAEAEHELDLFVTNPKLLSLLGEQKFVEGVEARQQASTRRAAPPQKPNHKLPNDRDRRRRSAPRLAQP